MRTEYKNNYQHKTGVKGKTGREFHLVINFKLSCLKETGKRFILSAELARRAGIPKRQGEWLNGLVSTVVTDATIIVAAVISRLPNTHWTKFSNAMPNKKRKLKGKKERHTSEVMVDLYSSVA